MYLGMHSMWLRYEPWQLKKMVKKKNKPEAFQLSVS